MPAAVAARPFEEHRVAERRASDFDGEFIRSLMRGLSDRKAGRMVPWSEVKDDLGIR